MNKIGFHARNIEELERVINIEGANLVELKPDKFRKNNQNIYFFNGNDFVIDNVIASEIKRLCDKKNITVQIHLPYEKKKNSTKETGLYQADRNHHDLLLKRYEMIGELYSLYGIGAVITTHPPAFGFNNKQFCSEDEALQAGREFYAKLDMLIKEKNYQFKVGIENLVAPKESGTMNIGYTPRQIDKLIGRTSEIGITVDSGHRLLNDKMSVGKLFSKGMIVNVHFHANPGIRSEKDYDDDEHTFANPKNLKHYFAYIKSFRRFKTPVILEIDKLEEFSDKYLRNYVMNLRREINSGD